MQLLHHIGWMEIEAPQTLTVHHIISQKMHGLGISESVTQIDTLALEATSWGTKACVVNRSLHHPLTSTCHSCLLHPLRNASMEAGSPRFGLVSLCWVPMRFKSESIRIQNPFRHMNQRMRQANPVKRICFLQCEMAPSQSLVQG